MHFSPARHFGLPRSVPTSQKDEAHPALMSREMSRFRRADGGYAWADAIDALLGIAANYGRDFIQVADMPAVDLRPEDFPRMMNALAFVAPQVADESLRRHWEWVERSQSLEKPHADDDFYDRVHALPPEKFNARLDAIMKRLGKTSMAGLHPEYDVDPPHGYRHKRPMRTLKPVAPVAVPERDLLADFAPAEYIKVITGRDVAPGRVCCPLPDHEDRNPACDVYAEPERGWWCFGCNRGGNIYALAAYVWGEPLPLRGPAYGRVRDRLKEMFGIRD